MSHPSFEERRIVELESQLAAKDEEIRKLRTLLEYSKYFIGHEAKESPHSATCSCGMCGLRARIEEALESFTRQVSE